MRCKAVPADFAGTQAPPLREIVRAPKCDVVARWGLDVIARELAPLLPGFTAHVVPSVDSTNSELMRRARAGCVEPVLLVAEHQTAGRGRLGRSWHGTAAHDADRSRGGAGPAPGSLTFSLGLALGLEDWSGLSLAVGVSVARSLDRRLRLKWPNDIWLQERKLAGILIETVSVEQHRYVVIGVGINIAPCDCAGLAVPPAWLQELLPDLDAPAALQRVVPALVQAIRLFETQGFAPFQAAFSACDLLRGRDVELSDGTQGVAAGVNDSGGLLVQTSRGLQTITSAEVSVRPSGLMRLGGVEASRS